MTKESNSRTLVVAMMVHVENSRVRAELAAERAGHSQAEVYRKTAGRAKRLLNAAMRYLRCHPPIDGYLTCDGKGGEYEVVGVAKGAGSSRGLELVVYRDRKDGSLFVRDPEDFGKRMVMAGGDPQVAALVAGGDPQAVALVTKEERKHA